MKRLENVKYDLIDVSKGRKKRGHFGGNNGKKRYWEYDNIIYMIKHQDRNNINLKFKSVRGTSIKGYNNAVLSEYIGSNLINFINFDNMFAQHTFLIKEHNQDNQKETFWVACEHLDKNRDDGFEFYTLSQIDEFDYADKNQNELNTRERHKISFDDMILWIKEIGSKSLNIDQDEFVQYFYNMFVIDAFLLNWDRNPTNWGFLIKYDENNDEIIDDIMFAPLIDQGSCLFAKQDSKNIDELDNIDFEDTITKLIKETQSFFLNDDNQNINYHDIIKNTNDVQLINTIERFLLKLEKLNFEHLFNKLTIPNEVKYDYLSLIILSNTLMVESLLENKTYQEMKQNKQQNNKNNTFIR